MLSKCWILCIIYFVTSSKAGIAPWIKPCRPLDSECIVKSAEIALPYFANGIEGVPAFEPLTLKDTRADTGDLQVEYKNVKVYQLSKCKFESIKRDPVKSTARIVTVCPSVIKGDYSMKGKLLFLDIFGDGKFSIGGGLMRSTTDLKIKSFVDKKGVKHYKIGSFEYTFEPMTKSDIEFENLYNGDEAKAGPVKQIMSDSWKELILDFGKPLMKECMTSIVNGIDNFFKVVPAEELELNE